MSDVTQILKQIESGDQTAAERLFVLVYDELRALAAAKLALEKPGQTLDATALVHEAYLRFKGMQTFADRRHFFCVAAEAIRRILIDRARRKLRLKHGGQRERVPLSAVDLVAQAQDGDLVALDEAFERFAAVEPIKAELVKLRYFVGLSEEEAAATLGISRATASRYWAYARAWLIEYLQSKGD